MNEPDGAMRLNRFLARCGFGSRRAVEELIRAGRVTVGGEVVTELATRVDPEARVAVDGMAAHLPREYRVYAFHKPHGVVSTLKAQKGQPSLDAYRRRADIPDRFVPVGRLDSETTGLLLWTDDGELSQALCRPRSRIWKTYEVDLDGAPGRSDIKLLTRGGIELDGRPCLPCRLERRPGGTDRQWIMDLHEGRKRQIRRMFKAVGLKVEVLHRVAVGPVVIGKLRPGGFRRLDRELEQTLRRLAAGTGKRET
jgi:pseudouridine synthase